MYIYIYVYIYIDMHINQAGRQKLRRSQTSARSTAGPFQSDRDPDCEVQNPASKTPKAKLSLGGVSKNQGALIGSKIVGLLPEGHQQKDPKCSNSHIDGNTSPYEEF